MRPTREATVSIPVAHQHIQNTVLHLLWKLFIVNVKKSNHCALDILKDNTTTSTELNMAPKASPSIEELIMKGQYYISRTVDVVWP